MLISNVAGSKQSLIASKKIPIHTSVFAQRIRSCGPNLIKKISFVKLRCSSSEQSDWMEQFKQATSGQSYKHFMLVNYDSRVVICGIFQSGTTLES